MKPTLLNQSASLTTAKPVERQERPKILVVDDEESLLTSLCDVLSISYSSHDILSASSAEAAMSLLRGTKTDLVITDLKLPVMTGLDLANNLKRIAPSARSILMTAYGNEAVKSLAGKAGCQSYLKKPFDIDVLLSHIDKALAVVREPETSKTLPSDSKANNGLSSLMTTSQVLSPYATKGDSLLSRRQLLHKQPVISLHTNPQTPEERAKLVQSLVNKGIGFFKERKLLEAKSCWEEALELDPNCPQAKHNMNIIAVVLKLRSEEM